MDVGIQGPNQAKRTRRATASERQATVLNKETQRQREKDAAMEAAAAKLRKGKASKGGKRGKSKGPLKDPEQMRKAIRIRDLSP